MEVLMVHDGMAGREARGAGFGSGRARRPGLVGVVGEAGVDLNAEEDVACWFEVEVEVEVREGMVDLEDKGDCQHSISAQARFESDGALTWNGVDDACETQRLWIWTCGS